MSTEQCPHGGPHKFVTDDGETFCAKCFEPSEDTAVVAKKKKKVKSKAAPKKVAEKRKTKKELAAEKRPKPTIEKALAALRPKPKKDEGNLSLVGAAAVVLADFPKGLKARDLFDEITKRKLWSTDKGKTPHQTLAAALSRLIDRDGKESKFARLDRGVFGLRA